MVITKSKLGNVIATLTDYHANGAYEKLKDNVELLDAENFAVMIRTTNFSKNEFTKNLNYITESAYDFLSKSKVYPEDIIMNKIADAGACYFMPDLKRPVSLGMNLFLIRIDKNVANPFFIFSCLKFNEHYVRSFASGSATKTITKEDVRRLKIYFPPLPEQRKIAQILSTWDKAIATTEKLIDASKQQKKALMQQLLTGKKRLIDPETGKAFEENWERTHLKSLLIEEKSRNKDNKITRVLSVTNHSGFVLPEDQFSKRVASENISNYKIVKQGQFGYNPSRLNVGSFACLNQFSEGVLSPMYVVFSTNDSKIQRDYLSYWMDSHEAKQRIKNSTQGSVRESVGFDALCSFPFILPALNEQQKIASVLTAADKEIELLEAKLAHLKQEKKALMQQLLTGKRRVSLSS
ncbi:restriction endonuclease subunit S [Vibrio splendidus]|uniref:restriction endonuclease subunit S n=1 Tax=Vibrio splendidus TaxID=29497 RepID=UPI0002EAD27E|nr:restriction endonuclease subunit S [Vibrio splendidus]OEF74903.1 hypothetical protein A148_17370 [Vibrio splendidus 1F-157]